MKCSESFDVNGIWVICQNPASVIAQDFKHGNDRGICSFCLWRLNKEDDSNFFNRHSFRDLE